MPVPELQEGDDQYDVEAILDRTTTKGELWYIGQVA